MGKRTAAKPAKPDDPIFQRGLQIYTPMSARPKPPEPPVEKEPPKE